MKKNRIINISSTDRQSRRQFNKIELRPTQVAVVVRHGFIILFDHRFAKNNILLLPNDRNE